MSVGPRKEKISVTMSWEDRQIFEAEKQRTGEDLSAMMLRLAKLGLQYEAQRKAAGTVVREVDDVATREPVRQLPANIMAAPSTEIVAVPAAGKTVAPSTNMVRSHDELTDTRAHPSHDLRSDRASTPAGYPSVGSDKTRWAAVGVLSTLLGMMLVPANSFGAAAISSVVLGQPGNGIAASNILFEHYSKRAGPLRHWNATNQVANNSDRVKNCANRADGFADYRRLAKCEILVPSRKRAIEVGQGIVD